MKYYIMFWAGSVDGKLIATHYGNGLIAFSETYGRVENVGIYERIEDAPDRWRLRPNAYKLFSVDIDTGEWLEVLCD